MTREASFQQCAAFRLARARAAAAAHYGDLLRPLELSPLALYAMGVLADRGSATPSEVADALDVSRPTVSSLVDRVVRDGWIRRCPHPDHRGKSLLVLTDAGRERIDDAYDRLRNADADLDRRLGGGLQDLLDQVGNLTRLLEGERSDQALRRTSR